MYFNSNTYSTTIHKPREQEDDGVWGATSPQPDRTAAQSGTSNMMRAALVGYGVYVGSQIYSNVTSNIKALTGSSKLQEDVKRGTFVVGTITAAIMTKGVSLVFQGTQQAIQYGMRAKLNAIDNEERALERELKGERVTNGLGRAYYD